MDTSLRGAAAPGSGALASFASLCARAARAAAGLLVPAKPLDPRCRQDPIYAEHAPEGANGLVLRHFVQPFAPESQEIAQAFARLIPPGKREWEGDAQTLDAAFDALARVRGPLPMADAERVVGMALSAELADLAIECSRQGLYYPWSAARGRFGQHLADYEEDMPIEKSQALHKLIAHADDPATRAAERACVERSEISAALAREALTAGPEANPAALALAEERAPRHHGGRRL
jgi:hypothetical protein